jgi:hypothetical protein
LIAWNISFGLDKKMPAEDFSRAGVVVNVKRLLLLRFAEMAVPQQGGKGNDGYERKL